jgi:hypothetical protein
MVQTALPRRPWCLHESRSRLKLSSTRHEYIPVGLVGGIPAADSAEKF